MHYFFPYNYQISICHGRKFQKHTKKEQEKEMSHALEPVHILIHVDPMFTVPAYVTCT